MSSIIRARNGLTGRSEVSEVIGLSPELKVAGPSMLGIGLPDRHALPRFTSTKMRRPRHALPPARAGSFFGASFPFPRPPAKVPSPDHNGHSALAAATALGAPTGVIPHPITAVRFRGSC